MPTTDRPNGSAPAPHAPLSRFRRVALGVALTLVASALAMAYLGWRQARLLDGHRRFSSEYGPWSAFQLEAETMRLHQAITRCLAEPGDETLQAAALRLELMISRIGLLEESDLPAVTPSASAARGTLALARQVAQDVDRVLGPTAPLPPSPDALRALLPRIEALADPLQTLSLEVHLDSHAGSEALREDLLRQQRLTWLLSALQGALLLGMAALALRKLHQLHQQQQLAHLADERQAARLAAEAASRAKSAFLANMSHELRTPFHGMLGMLALLERTALDDSQADYVRTAQASARHLLAILNDILDISKLESGRLGIVPGPAHLPTLLDEVERLMRALAQDKGLALRVLRDPALPDWVLVDALRLKQILFNLLGNAIKFTERGEVVLAVRGSSDETAATRLVLSVSDTGPGIAAADLARLFTRFQQGDVSISRRHGGTGLGLEISRSLARMMGGDIVASSEPGQGAIFTASIALAQPVQPIGPLQALPPTPAALPSSPPASLPGLRVLVCEDHDVNRKYLAALLDGLQTQATFCGDGAQAVLRVRQQAFDIVLMDVHTPVMDGLQATRTIRALPPPFVQPRIIALTADAFDESRDRALAAGMNDFMSKPVDPLQLSWMLARHAPQAVLRAARAAQADARADGQNAADDTAAAHQQPPPRADRPTAWAAELAHLSPWLDARAIQRLARNLPQATWQTLVQRLLADEPGSMRALDTALRAGDAGAAIEAAHALRGSAANMGLAALAAQAQTLETQARCGPMPDADVTGQSLQQLVQATQSALALLSPMTNR